MAGRAPDRQGSGPDRQGGPGAMRPGSARVMALDCPDLRLPCQKSASLPSGRWGSWPSAGKLPERQGSSPSSMEVVPIARAAPVPGVVARRVMALDCPDLRLPCHKSASLPSGRWGSWPSPGEPTPCAFRAPVGGLRCDVSGHRCHVVSQDIGDGGVVPRCVAAVRVHPGAWVGVVSRPPGGPTILSHAVSGFRPGGRSRAGGSRARDWLSSA